MYNHTLLDSPRHLNQEYVKYAGTNRVRQPENCISLLGEIGRSNWEGIIKTHRIFHALDTTSLYSFWFITLNEIHELDI